MTRADTETVPRTVRFKSIELELIDEFLQTNPSFDFSRPGSPWLSLFKDQAFRSKPYSSEEVGLNLAQKRESNENG